MVYLVELSNVGRCCDIFGEQAVALARRKQKIAFVVSHGAEDHGGDLSAQRLTSIAQKRVVEVDEVGGYVWDLRLDRRAGGCRVVEEPALGRFEVCESDDDAVDSSNLSRLIRPFEGTMRKVNACAALQQVAPENADLRALRY